MEMDKWILGHGKSWKCQGNCIVVMENKLKCGVLVKRLGSFAMNL